MRRLVFRSTKENPKWPDTTWDSGSIRPPALISPDPSIWRPETLRVSTREASCLCIPRVWRLGVTIRLAGGWRAVKSPEHPRLRCATSRSVSLSVEPQEWNRRLSSQAWRIAVRISDIASRLRPGSVPPTSRRSGPR